MSADYLAITERKTKSYAHKSTNVRMRSEGSWGSHLWELLKELEKTHSVSARAEMKTKIYTL